MLEYKQNEMSLETFVYPFKVVTRNRVFELYAETSEKREMWFDGFNYAIVSTKIVQEIIRESLIIIKENYCSKYRWTVLMSTKRSKNGKNKRAKQVWRG